MSPPRRPAIVAVLVAVLAGSWLVLVSPPARAGTAIVFGEDFESGVLGAQWAAADNDPASGLDYWDVTNYRNHTGNFSAWSAQVGTQATGGQNNSAVHRYDNDMQADLVIDLQVNGFTGLTLSFYYWSRAESGGGDFIQAWYEAGGVQFPIFTNTGNANWDLASVAVPTNVERLIIRFQTDPANNNFEGAYVDDVVLTGTENEPPTSSVDPLPVFTNAVPSLLPYTAQDNANASGVAYVELWWRMGTAGAFTLYTRPANPLGRWLVSPISFDPQFAAGDGYYEFYTIAVDRADNAEAAPAGADSSMTVDTVAPTLSILSPLDGDWFSSASQTVTWQGSDSGVGLDRYEATLDAMTPTTEGLATTKTYSDLSDGTHRVAVAAHDRAGNAASVEVGFGTDTVSPTVQISTPTAGRRFHVTDILFRWSAQDATSGVDSFEVWIDGGAHLSTSATELTIEKLADGAHTFHVRVYDAAGNSAEARVTFRVVTSPWDWEGPYGPFPLLALILGIIAALLSLYLLWKRRKDEDTHRPPTPEEVAENETPPTVEDTPDETANPPDQPGPE